jgi:hypothetical protein
MAVDAKSVGKAFPPNLRNATQSKNFTQKFKLATPVYVGPNDRNVISF